MKFIENARLHYIVIFVLAIGLYVNTLSHQFVLDDEVVIQKNVYVQQGLNGIADIFSHDSFAGYARVGESLQVLEGGRYRPLSLAFFTLLYSLFGSNPFPFHLFAVLLYGASCLLLFRLLLLMLNGHTGGIWIAFVSTLLFVIHPVHTEVVANVKGCDEQLALFFGLASMYSLFKWWDMRKSQWMIFAGICYLLACLAKENALTLLVLAPLALSFFRNAKSIEILRFASPLILSGILFLILRIGMIGAENEIDVMEDPLNNPFLVWNGNSWEQVPISTKAATILYTFGQYVRLMVLPYPLTHDYYPFHIPLQNFLNLPVLISLFILIGLIIYGIRSIRLKEIGGYGVLFFLIALSITSNIVFPVGTFMAERFLFFPSVGFAISIAALGYNFSMKFGKKYLFLPIIAVSIAFSGWIFQRNAAWKDNETLLQNDLTHSAGSVKLRNDLGTILLTRALQSQDPTARKKLLEEASGHLQFAVEGHKTYYDAYLAYGATSFYLQQYERSVNAYRTASALHPQDPMAKTGLLYALQGFGVDTGTKGDPMKAITIFTEAWKLQPDTTSAIELYKYYAVLKQSSQSLNWLQQAASLVPNDAQMKYRLAKAFYEAGNQVVADSVYQEAKKLDASLPGLK